MKPTPPGWPRISSALFYDDGAAAIDWLCRAFGFEVRLKIEDDSGRVAHSELTFGEAVIMLADVSRQNPHASQPFKRSPKSAGNVNTQHLCIFVDDVDAHCARAREAGARILMEPTTNDYGDDNGSNRIYGAEDPEGHAWSFMQRLRDPRQ